MTSLAPEPTNIDTDDDELEHITCCKDEYLTLCGKIDTSPLAPEGIEMMNPCVVCVDLHRNPAYCPKLDMCHLHIED